MTILPLLFQDFIAAEVSRRKPTELSAAHAHGYVFERSSTDLDLLIEAHDKAKRENGKAHAATTPLSGPFACPHSSVKNEFIPRRAMETTIHRARHPKRSSSTTENPKNLKGLLGDSPGGGNRPTRHWVSGGYL